MPPTAQRTESCGRISMTGFKAVSYTHLGLDHIADENAGKQRHNRHNHRVAYEVEEGEEIHAQNLNMAPYAVAQGGW